MSTAVDKNRQAWEKRSRLWGASLRSVLFKGIPEVLNEHLHVWHQRMVRQALRHSAPERLLDAGCGYGRLSRALKEEYSDLDVTGMDVTENFVKLYKKHTGYDAFIGNVESLPDDIGTFSHILCVTVLMYVAEDRLDETVAGLLRCLAPGGTLVVIEPNLSGLPFQTAFGLLRRKGERKRARDGEVDTVGRHFTHHELASLLERHGGTVLEECRIPVTTLCILPMFVIGRFLPRPLARAIFRLAAGFDRLLEHLKLPTLHSVFFIRAPESNPTRDARPGPRAEPALRGHGADSPETSQ